MGVLGGVIVAPIVGRILDCTKSYVPMTAVVMVMFATSILTVMFAAFPGNEVTLSMTVTATGAMYGSLSTVLFEAMAELFYPINPFVANTMVMVLINMVGYLMIAALTFLGEKNYQWYINGDDSGDTMGGDMVFMVMSVMIYCGCFALFSVERVYKRTQAEEIAKSNAMLTGASEYAADVVNPAKMGGFRPTLMYVGGQKKVRDGTTFFEDEADDDEDESNDEEMFIGSVNSINSYRESNYRESSRMQEWDANAD